MNKYFLISILLAFALFGSACGSVNASKVNSSTNNAMTPALELALGTLKLEETDQAVDSEMAAQLLPLWQIMSELKANGSTADEELNAVVEQIKSTMTAEQIQAINDMQISRKDIAAAMQSGESSNANTTASSNKAQNGAGGGMGGGMIPSEAGGMPAGGLLPDAGGAAGGPITSVRVSSAQNANSTGSNALIEQVIQLLESKLQSG